MIQTRYKLSCFNRGGPPSNHTGIYLIRDSEEYREGTNEKYLERKGLKQNLKFVTR